MSIASLGRMLDEHVSPERLARYRALAGNDERKAINLYLWNVLLSGALLELISFIEVPLRNALAHELAALAEADEVGGPWWTRREWFDDRSLEDIDFAIEKLMSRGQGVTHGRLVAELNLSFWRFLLDKKHDRTLWRSALYRAFPGQTIARSDVYDAVVLMNKVRNRIAHHEPVVERDHLAMERRFLDVAGWICADYQHWAAAKSRVTKVVALKP